MDDIFAGERMGLLVNTEQDDGVCAIMSSLWGRRRRAVLDIGGEDDQFPIPIGPCVQDSSVMEPKR